MIFGRSVLIAGSRYDRVKQGSNSLYDSGRKTFYEVGKLRHAF